MTDACLLRVESGFWATHAATLTILGTRYPADVEEHSTLAAGMFSPGSLDHAILVEAMCEAARIALIPEILFSVGIGESPESPDSDTGGDDDANDESRSNEDNKTSEKSFDSNDAANALLDLYTLNAGRQDVTPNCLYPQS